MPNPIYGIIGFFVVVLIILHIIHKDLRGKKEPQQITNNYYYGDQKRKKKIIIGIEGGLIREIFSDIDREDVDLTIYNFDVENDPEIDINKLKDDYRQASKGMTDFTEHEPEKIYKD